MLKATYRLQISRNFTFQAAAALVGKLFAPLGMPAAVLITAVAFTAAHGVIVDIPVILATGIGLGYMRAATGSIYPCIALHGFFNGFGLVVAALVARG